MNSIGSWKSWFEIMRYLLVFDCFTAISKGSSKLHLLIIFVYLQVDFFPYIKKRHSNFVIYTRAWPLSSYFNHSKAQESWTFHATWLVTYPHQKWHKWYIFRYVHIMNYSQHGTRYHLIYSSSRGKGCHVWWVSSL